MTSTMNAHDEDSDPVHRVDGSSSSPLVLTAEHASRRLPHPYLWHEEDAWLAETHWAFDLYARELTLELAEAFDAPAVMAGFSRLLVDPNRPEDSDELFRREAEGKRVELNHALEEAERRDRLERFYRPYHEEASRLIQGSRAPIALAVHTFTPIYDGAQRTLEVGVLFNREEALAERMRDAFAAVGLEVALNEPYSGKLGLMHSVDLHASRFGKAALEIEVRQDLSGDPGFRRAVVAAVGAFLGEMARG